MRMLWLREDCLAAGLKVVEVDGWHTRGVEFTAMPTTVVCHHTATAASAKGDLPTRRILINGRSDLPGPLCQVGLGRNGTVYLIASGKANHAGKGAWKGETTSARTLGIEAEHPGTGPWPDKQYDAYVRLVAVLLRGIGQNAERACGHKEWALPAGRKSDPNFDMAPFRSLVRAQLTTIADHGGGKGTSAPTTEEWDEMATKDEIKQAVAEALADSEKRIIAAAHKDALVLLRGTADGTHPNNLTNIGKAVGVPQ
jgi:hypothetical protein